ncbi:MAG: TIGR02281 family clan AA aspartic protease [Rhizobiales bacterium]|nr:TIGR02281 family clan AA aspartic protease [Hyphomicrobiales bacterium]
MGLWVLGCGLVFASVWYADDIASAIKPLTQKGIEIGQDVARDMVQQPAERAQEPTGDGSRVYLTADHHNQFFAKARINGRPIDVLVDTGASHVSLRYEDAKAVGIHLYDSDFTHEAQTANGRTRVAPVVIDQIRIGNIVVRDVKGLVGEPGKNFVTLLGMAFLSKLKSVSISGRRLELVN